MQALAEGELPWLGKVVPVKLHITECAANSSSGTDSRSSVVLKSREEEQSGLGGVKSKVLRLRHQGLLAPSAGSQSGVNVSSSVLVLYFVFLLIQPGVTLAVHQL